MSRWARGLGGLLLTAGLALAQENPLPPGPGADLAFAKCQACHSLNYVLDSQGLPPFLWEDTVHLMVRLGMQATEEEQAQLTKYLSTYLGPNPPPDPPAGETGAEGEAGGETDGAAVYATNCAACHGPEAGGVPGAFPPLAGHAPRLLAAEAGRDYLRSVLLYGLQGEIAVLGQTYGGVMPAWGHLSDADLAAVLNHVLSAWGNDALLPEDFAPYAPDEIAEGRGAGLSPSEVLERRPEPAEAD